MAQMGPGLRRENEEGDAALNHLKWSGHWLTAWCSAISLIHFLEAAMPSEISDEALDFLLARAGLSLSDAQKAELKGVYAGIAAMAERVRKPRGRMAEPALTYGFAEEDLP